MEIDDLSSKFNLTGPTEAETSEVADLHPLAAQSGQPQAVAPAGETAVPVADSGPGDAPLGESRLQGQLMRDTLLQRFDGAFAGANFQAGSSSAGSGPGTSSSTGPGTPAGVPSGAIPGDFIPGGSGGSTPGGTVGVTITRSTPEGWDNPDNLPAGLRDQWHAAQREADNDVTEEQIDQLLNASDETGILASDSYQADMGVADDAINDALQNEPGSSDQVGEYDPDVAEVLDDAAAGVDQEAGGLEAGAGEMGSGIGSEGGIFTGGESGSTGGVDGSSGDSGTSGTDGTESGSGDTSGTDGSGGGDAPSGPDDGGGGGGEMPGDEDVGGYGHNPIGDKFGPYGSGASDGDGGGSDDTAPTPGAHHGSGSSTGTGSSGGAGSSGDSGGLGSSAPSGDYSGDMGEIYNPRADILDVEFQSTALPDLQPGAVAGPADEEEEIG